MAPDHYFSLCQFLEVELAKGYWRSFQHKEWGSDKAGKAYRFKSGHWESESEPVSQFVALKPGTYRVRVCMVLDRGMVKASKAKSPWVGVVRSNIVKITIPRGK